MTNISYLFHLYKNMDADALVRHYAYLTQAMVRHATAMENRALMEAVAERKTASRKVEPKKEKKPRKPRGQLNATKTLKI